MTVYRMVKVFTYKKIEDPNGNIFEGDKRYRLKISTIEAGISQCTTDETKEYYTDLINNGWALYSLFNDNKLSIKFYYVNMDYDGDGGVFHEDVYNGYKKTILTELRNNIIDDL